MKERPILFSAPMVRAILDGSKTQTRRLVKGQALEWLAPEMFTPQYVADADNGLCPYGKPGDRLWVRETCAAEELQAGQDGVRFRADGAFVPIADDAGASIDWLKLYTYRGKKGATVPPIHMPRWASRITLEITGVRVERLQDISEEDAIAEGCSAVGGLPIDGPYGPLDCDGHSACDDFAGLWESINGAGSWDANPWVWIVEFKKL